MQTFARPGMRDGTGRKMVVHPAERVYCGWNSPSIFGSSFVFFIFTGKSNGQSPHPVFARAAWLGFTSILARIPIFTAHYIDWHNSARCKYRWLFYMRLSEPRPYAEENDRIFSRYESWFLSKVHIVLCIQGDSPNVELTYTIKALDNN